MHVTLGSSDLDVPFSFPNVSIAGRMENRGVSTSWSRPNQLVAMYWDGIDGKKIMPITDDPLSQSAAAQYLSGRGVAGKEAAAFISALASYPDKTFRSPYWSYTKALVQDVTDTGYTNEEGSKTPSLTAKIIWPVLGAVALYAFFTQGLPKILVGRKK